MATESKKKTTKKKTTRKAGATNKATRKTSAKKATKKTSGKSTAKKGSKKSGSKGSLVLINGANGFLGPYVVREALARGWKVRTTDLAPKPAPQISELGVDYIRADLADMEQARKITQGCTHVINVAGLFRFGAPKELLYKANATCTRNQCQAALEAGVERFVHVATIGVYGKYPMRKPVRENHPHNPKNDYEKSKKAGEDIAFQYHQRYNLPVISVRPSVIYGPGSRYPVALVASLMSLQKAIGQKAVDIGIDVRIQQVHVEDVARALVWMLDHGQVGRAYHVADETPISWGDLCAFIRQEIGLERERKVDVPLPVARALGYVLPLLPRSVLDKQNEKLHAGWKKMQDRFGITGDLAPGFDKDFFTYLRCDHLYDLSAIRGTGFELKWPDARKGLSETIEWYRRQAWLPRFEEAGRRAA